MTAVVINIVAAAVVPWLIIGLIAKTKAKWAGRKGAPLLQPLYDAVKLVRKGMVVSRSTTPIFAAAPAISLVAVCFAALTVPGPAGNSIVSFSGDLVLFAYLLALARFLGIIAALDTGSSFEGMGASREAFFSTLAEPGLFLILSSLLLASGTDSLSGIGSHLAPRFDESGLLPFVAALGLYLMILVEGHRLPVDDPATHLELTMIHEVMVLDNSGRDLSMITYASGLKMYLFGALAANLLVPRTVTPAAHAGIFLGIFAVITISVGLIESWVARLRMTHVPQFIFVLNIAGILLFFLALLGVKS
ncbi:MAG TPA: NADH-quinone oxidoreductase subunit H [Spirochaetia bacterium]|nr:NADH-quinone oxidoreductase subunit H [Spirochaetia bacterium]